MNLLTEIVQYFHCLDCGFVHSEVPTVPCCVSPDEWDAPDDRLLTLDEVADAAQVSKATVSGWISKGELAALKDGRVVRVPRSAYREFVNTRTRRA